MYHNPIRGTLAHSWHERNHGKPRFRSRSSTFIARSFTISVPISFPPLPPACRQALCQPASSPKSLSQFRSRLGCPTVYLHIPQRRWEGACHNHLTRRTNFDQYLVVLSIFTVYRSRGKPPTIRSIRYLYRRRRSRCRTPRIR